MGKGTPSLGKKNKKASHTMCRRCGRRSFHTQKRTCAACGFGRTAKIRAYNWHKPKDFSRK